MCVSFQFQKHLSLGRGGVILTDDLAASEKLRQMVYDGRVRGVPWRSQDIDTWAAPQLAACNFAFSDS